MLRISFPTFFLLLIFIAMGYVFVNYSWQDPSHIVDPPEVKSVDDAHGTDGGGEPILVDSRPELDYQKRAGVRAINLNADNWNSQFLVLLSSWIPGTAVVVYDDAAHHFRAVDIAKRLMANNCKPVYVLTGGVDDLPQTVVPGIDNAKYHTY